MPALYQTSCTCPALNFCVPGRRDADAVAAHAAFLRDEMLLHSEAVPALGLSLHLADIAVPELRAACEEGGAAAAPVPWPALKVCMPLPSFSGLRLLFSELPGSAARARHARGCKRWSTGACVMRV